MKRLSFFAVLLAFLLPSCEEIPPVINPIMGPIEDTTTVDVTNQKRQVLIEEFTGVRCVQCPAGAVEIENLKLIHGDQLVAVSIHAGGFAPPFNESNHDFRTVEGEDLLNFLGQPFGYPSAVVDRKLFPDEFDLQLSKGQWPGFIADEKQIDPKVKIGLEVSFDGGTRKLDVDVTLFVQENITDEDVRLTVLITEDGIVDVQDTPDGKVEEYEHNHVMRDMFTSYDGNALTTPMLTGDEVIKSYSMTIPADWVVGNCHVVAFVNLGGASKEVLQAHEVKLSE